MKRIFLILAISCLALSSFAQARMRQGAALSVEKIPREKKEKKGLYWRPYIEANGIFGNRGGQGFVGSLVPLGWQPTSSIWFGFGFNLGLSTNTNYSSDVDYFGADDIGHSEGFFNLFTVFKYSFPHRQFLGNGVPYISASVGLGSIVDGDGGLYSQLKFGNTFYSSSKKAGISVFAGLMLMPQYVYPMYDDGRGLRWERERGRTHHNLYFNLGINFEFGGTRGFRR